MEGDQKIRKNASCRNEFALKKRPTHERGPRLFFSMWMNFPSVSAQQKALKSCIGQTPKKPETALNLNKSIQRGHT